MKKAKIFVFILVGILTLIASFPAFAAKVKPSYYYQHNVSCPDSTAYVGNNSPAGGGSPYIGMVAVHPKTPVDRGGSVFDPVIPFGTVIHLTSPSSIPIQGNSYSTFTVKDTGDVDWDIHSSTYWVDVYFGADTPANEYACSVYGTKPLSYWFYDWVN